MTLPALPANLPPIGKARLPATYEGAKVALAECTRLDECQDWADKAEALASYAKQAQDDEMRKMADRIQARAIRRCGELLQQIASATGAHLKREGALPFSRTRAADDAGLSEHQRKTALRVARIPGAEFEDAVEGDEPATVTTLAERGTQHLNGRSPMEFRAATSLLGLLNHIVRTSRTIDVAEAVKGLAPKELTDALDAVDASQEWLRLAAVTLEDIRNV